jgi:hypothetical protein
VVFRRLKLVISEKIFEGRPARLGPSVGGIPAFPDIAFDEARVGRPCDAKETGNELFFIMDGFESSKRRFRVLYDYPSLSRLN